MPTASRATELKLLYGFGVAVFACCAAFALVFVGFAASDANTRAIVHAEDVVATLNDLVVAVQDGERSQRGYLLTGDLAYLEPYEAARSRFPNALAALGELVSDDAAQRERLDRLETAIAAKFDELHETVSLIRAGDREQALDVVRTDRGAREMDDIVRIVAEMESAQQARLTVRRAELDRSRRRTRLAIVGLGVLLVLATSAAFLWVRRDLRRREATEAALRKANEQLAGALDEVKELGGILPICSYCKAIRDDQNYWQRVEEYIGRHTEAEFSHGICPSCYDEHVQPQLDALEREAAGDDVERETNGASGRL